MNDLYYITYKPELMLSDSMDMDAETELAHRRLCDFIWRMDKAPKADNEFLKQFTKTRSSDWGRVKKGLIEKGWAEVAGMFLHKGAIDTLNEAKENYAAQCNQTAPATAKKNGTELKQTVCERDPVSGIVTLKVITVGTVSATPPAAASVTAIVTGNVTTPQLEPEPVKEREQAFPEANVPTWNEVKVMANMAGIPETVARAFFDHYDSKNLWRNKHGLLINVRPSLLIWANNERQGKPNANHRSTNPGGPDRNAGTYNQNRDHTRAKAKIR